MLVLQTTNTQKHFAQTFMLQRLLVLLRTPTYNGGSRNLWGGCQARKASYLPLPPRYLTRPILSTFLKPYLFRIPYHPILFPISLPPFTFLFPAVTNPSRLQGAPANKANEFGVSLSMSKCVPVRRTASL